MGPAIPFNHYNCNTSIITCLSFSLPVLPSFRAESLSHLNNLPSSRTGLVPGTTVLNSYCTLRLPGDPKPHLLSQYAQSGPGPPSKVWKPNCTSNSNENPCGEHSGLSKGQLDARMPSAKWLCLGNASCTKQFRFAFPNLILLLHFLVKPTHTSRPETLKKFSNAKTSKSTWIPFSFTVLALLILSLQCQPPN